MRGSKPDICLLAGILSATTVVLFGFDDQIITLVQKDISRELQSTARLFSDTTVAVFYLIFAILLSYAYFKKSRLLKGVIGDYLKAQIIFSFLIVRILKICLGRARPNFGSEFTFLSMEADFNSFPSGHSSDAFVSAIFLFFLLIYSPFAKYRFVPLILAFLVAASRVAGLTHYASDTVAGAAIGAIGACFFISRLNGQQIALPPGKGARVGSDTAAVRTETYAQR